jgi:hypothetical protein
MVARLLKSCGLILGPDTELVGPDAGNVDGHFEHRQFVKINEAILSHFGGSGASPPTLKIGWEMEPGITELVSEAKLLVESFRGYPIWGWKDPRTTLLLPFWKQIVPQLRYIICVRSPLEVARSLWARDRMPVEQGALLWNRYITAAIRHTDGSPRIFTFYEDFFHEPLPEIGHLVDFCGLPLPPDQPTVVDMISKPLRHHVSTTMELMAEEKVLPEYKLFYLSLRAVSVAGSSVDQEKNVISAACGEVAALIDEFHSQNELTKLQSALAARELAMKFLIEENRSLKVSLDSFAQSLTWQLSKKFEKLKERLLPADSSMRKIYDQVLIRIKKSSFLRPPA